MYIPKNIIFKDIGISNIKICWNIDNINIINIDKNKIKYKLELRKENEKFEKIYEGNETNYIINSLSSNINYEFRICSFYNDLISLWTEIKPFNLLKLSNLVLKDNLRPNKQIKLWQNENGKADDEYILLEPKGIQYGPYIHYELGKYLIIYYGEGLLNGDFDAVDSKMNFPLKIINKSQNKISYEINISQKGSNGVEFRVFNNKKSFVLIKNIEVYKYNN